jgi:hypothetical protein
LEATKATAQTAYDDLETQYNDLWAQALDTQDTTEYDALVLQAEALVPDMDTAWA